jgi:Transposase DDE domain
MEQDSTASEQSPRMSLEVFVPQAQEVLQQVCKQHDQQQGSKHPRGHPLWLSAPQLWMGLLLCLLRGMQSQRDLWRLLCWEGFWHFAPVAISDQAIYNRLERDGVKPLEQLWCAVTRVLEQRLAPYAQAQLAPFARGVYALDETVLDRVARWLAPLRGLPLGASELLPGKIAGVFDVRLQQWRDFRFLPDATEHCSVQVRDLLRLLAQGSLLLFDRGYFSFPWLDELTRLGYWWVCRLRTHTRYTLIHVYFQSETLFDGLVWLGSQRDQAACAVRLVQVRCGGVCYRYVSNVLEPSVLSAAQIVQLYSRRWDIELAFRALKEHLGLRLLWSSKLAVIQQQCLACLILVQLLHAFQVELAARAEVDVFDVSLALLLKALPSLLQRGIDPIAHLLEHGRAMGIIRPSTRRPVHVPLIPLWQMVWPPPDLVLVRQARYAHSGKQARRQGI